MYPTPHEKHHRYQYPKYSGSAASQVQRRRDAHSDAELTGDPVRDGWPSLTAEDRDRIFVRMLGVFGLVLVLATAVTIAAVRYL